VADPFWRGWSDRLARLPPLPRPWEILQTRLAEFWAQQARLAATAARHEHYCEVCDGEWLHEGRMCAVPWAFPCARHHQDGRAKRARTGRWLIVVRRDRAELSQELIETFGEDPRVTVILDRRQAERRGAPASRASAGAERRRGSDRRAPATDKDAHVWVSVGFRPHRAGFRRRR
jgi:hypothetical protein